MKQTVTKPRMPHAAIIVGLALFIAVACGTKQPSESLPESAVQSAEEATQEALSNGAKAVALIESLESGDKAPVAYINPNKYIQHNLGVEDGLAGFGKVMQMAPPEGFKAKVIRSFEDGPFVVTHTEYDFFGPKVGFDIFRFEDGLIVEHWDNLAEKTVPNPSGRTQLDGETEVTNLDQTEANKTLVRGFITDVLQNGQADKLTQYVSTESYLQHNSQVADGLDGLGAALAHFAKEGLVMEYHKLHRILGLGNFVLSVSEGKFGTGDHVAYYDLFRIADGKIVEHWDIIETIPPESEWANQNGKF